MGKDGALAERPSPTPFWIITAAYIVVASIAVWRNWQHMLAMEPNEWGDIAAGVFSPLAFLWFLYTALAQRAELKLQQEELKSNTQAQRDQESQMTRQANAMVAQVEYLRAQATAQFQPIFVLESSGQGTTSTDVALLIRNEGPAVLDVQLEGGSLEQLVDRTGSTVGSTRGGVLPHWPSDFRVWANVPALAAAAPGGGPHDRVFRIRVTRLDSVRYRLRYRYVNDEQRLVLEGADVVNLATDR